MKGYVFSFPGMCLGGTAVVIARDARKARHMVLKDPNLKSLELDPKDIEIRSTFELEERTAYVDNGDY